MISNLFGYCSGASVRQHSLKHIFIDAFSLIQVIGFSKGTVDVLHFFIIDVYFGICANLPRNLKRTVGHLFWKYYIQLYILSCCRIGGFQYPIEERGYRSSINRTVRSKGSIRKTLNQLLIYSNCYLLFKLWRNILIIAKFRAKDTLCIYTLRFKPHRPNQRYCNIFTSSLSLRVKEGFALHRKVPCKIFFGRFNIFIGPGRGIYIRERLNPV